MIILSPHTPLCWIAGPTLAFSGEASVTSILAEDCTSPIITGGGGSAPLLKVTAIQGPPGGGGEAYSLCVDLGPSEWTYSRALAVRSSRIGGLWQRVDGVALTALISRSAAAQMEQQRYAARRRRGRVFAAMVYVPCGARGCSRGVVTADAYACA